MTREEILAAALADIENGVNVDWALFTVALIRMAEEKEKEEK